MSATTLEYALNAAIRLEQSNHLDDAEKLYRQIISQHPNCADALHLLGVLHARRGQNAPALELIRKAIALHPQVASFHANLGNVLIATGDLTAAAESFRQAIKINPDSAQALHALGWILLQRGRPDDAIDCLKKSVALVPDSSEVQTNLAIALAARGRFDEALAAIDKATELRPDWAAAWSNRAKILRDHGQLEESVTSARRALAISPDLPEAQINLTAALLDSGQIDSALDLIQRTLQLAPQNPSAQNLAANVLKETGDMPAAIAALDRALELDPNNAAFHSNKVYLLLFDPRQDSAALLAEQRRWALRHAQPLKKFIKPHENSRDPSRRLRIGYFSRYFHDHAQAFFLVPLLESHDHKNFEIHCYSDVVHPDAVTARLQRCADSWHVTTGHTDEELAEQIRRDRIDILVDLVMHMAHNRALAFARKPAPVQAAWLAYPGGVGMDAIDYRLTDPYLDPPASGNDLYSERSLRLPHCFWCYNALSNETVSDLPALKNGHITFGCLNNFCKVNGPVLNLWARTLISVPHSRMLLLAPPGRARERVHATFASHAIDPRRIEFVGRLNRSDYLRTYTRIDIALDTFPYNGHTTTLDSLWMGVPVVSLIGPTVVGRAGFSQLSNLNLAHLAASTPDAFVQIAHNLAADIPALSNLRQSLRQRMSESPLTNGKLFARSMESTFREMWSNFCSRKV